MAILFAGTSLSDFTLGGSPTEYTSSNKDTYVAEGIQCAGNTQSIARLDLPVSYDDIWVSFYMAHSGGTGTVQTGISFYGTAFSTTNPLVRLNGGSGNTTMFGEYWNGTAMTNFATSLTSSGMNGLHRYDIHCKIADSGGVFEVYRDGVLDLSWAGGDTKYTVATGVNRITFGTAGVGTTQFSAIIVATEDTRAMRMTQQLPNAAGALSQWSGAYTDIDETGFNDADLISTSVTGNISTFAFPAINAAFNSPSYEVAAVIESIRASSSVAADTDVAAVIRTSGTNYESGALGVNASVGTFQHVWNVNPNTSLAWTYSQASGAEIGVKQVL